MLTKPLAIAAVAVATAGALAPDEAAAGDPGVGALFGAALGAAIGHNISGRDGAVVGGVLGAMTGASIAAASDGYYEPGYAPAAPVAYAPPPVYYSPPVYYRPAPTVYVPAPVVVRPRPVYVREYVPRRPVYAAAVAERRHEWREHAFRDGREGPERRWR